uniref:Uncharacterized protein n=1 Tax=Tetranychus urticae TaxID=32264 RepID=T1JUG5_TETUR
MSYYAQARGIKVDYEKILKRLKGDREVYCQVTELANSDHFCPWDLHTRIRNMTKYIYEVESNLSSDESIKGTQKLKKFAVDKELTMITRKVVSLI